MEDLEQVIIDAIIRISETNNSKVNPNKTSVLLGQNGLVDSMGLVELCLVLEDLALELNFEFDWASEKAMSSSKSIFKSVETLATEFNLQKNAAKW